jgi:hypothetical protein
LKEPHRLFNWGNGGGKSLYPSFREDIYNGFVLFAASRSPFFTSGASRFYAAALRVFSLYYRFENLSFSQEALMV